jgi:hypothetical protein
MLREGSLVVIAGVRRLLFSRTHSTAAHSYLYANTELAFRIYRSALALVLGGWYIGMAHLSWGSA